MAEEGRTIALYGDTGSGKTTQIGEYAKWRFKASHKRTRYVGTDPGGSESIKPHIKLGIIDAVFPEEESDPWLFLDDQTNGKSLEKDHGALVIDSGTSNGEWILNAITKDPRKVGQQNTQRFTVGSGTRTLTIGANNESHYGLVQSFLRDQMWKSTWLIKKDIDVIWTFSVLRGEKQDDTPVIGPMLAGKALTPSIPKWFRYTFRLVSVPTVAGESPRHLLYLQEQPDFGGTGMSFGNSRYPLDATTRLPAVIEPASIVVALETIEKGQQEAEDALRLECGL